MERFNFQKFDTHAKTMTLIKMVADVSLQFIITRE